MSIKENITIASWGFYGRDKALPDTGHAPKRGCGLCMNGTPFDRSAAHNRHLHHLAHPQPRHHKNVCWWALRGGRALTATNGPRPH